MKTQLTVTTGFVISVKYFSKKSNNKTEKLWDSARDPEKESQESRLIVKTLETAFQSEDKPMIYCAWLISILNLNRMI